MHHIKAIITKQTGKQRLGRGFSPTELKNAGLNKQQAKQMGVRVDVKRKSVNDKNVEILKAHAEKIKPEAQANLNRKKQQQIQDKGRS